MSKDKNEPIIYSTQVQRLLWRKLPKDIRKIVTSFIMRTKERQKYKAAKLFRQLTKHSVFWVWDDDETYYEKWTYKNFFKEKREDREDRRNGGYSYKLHDYASNVYASNGHAIQ